MLSEMAWRAASLISSGAEKSGKPCERFTAWCFNARRVISRITDSVNCSALAESIRRETCVILDSGELISPSQADEIAAGGAERCQRLWLTALAIEDAMDDALPGP